MGTRAGSRSGAGHGPAVPGAAARAWARASRLSATCANRSIAAGSICSSACSMASILRISGLSGGNAQEGGGEGLEIGKGLVVAALLIPNDFLLAGDEGLLLSDPGFGVTRGTNFSGRMRPRSLGRSFAITRGRLEIRSIKECRGYHLEEGRDPIDLLHPDAAPPAKDHREPRARVAHGLRQFRLGGAGLLQPLEDLPPEVIKRSAHWGRHHNVNTQ